MDNILNNLSKDDKTLVKSVLDKYRKYEKTNISTYTNFLDMREYKLVVDILRRLKIDFNAYIPSLECEKNIIYLHFGLFCRLRMGAVSS